MMSIKLTKDGGSFEDRLFYFVTNFVFEIETTLKFHHDILEKKIKKSGKAPEVIAGIIGIALKYLTGDDEVAKLLVTPLKIPFENYYEKKSYSYADLAYNLQIDPEEGRKLFVEIGIDVFKSFEYQFMIIDTEHGPRPAMIKLGKDAAHRFLNFVKNNGSTQDSSSTEMSKNKLEARNVVYGKSKKYFFDKFCNIFGNLECYIISKADNSKLYWNTEDLFEKSGIVKRENDEFNFYKSKESECERYYYRQLFRDENILGSEYETVNEPEFKFTYTPDSIYQQHKEIILSKIEQNPENFVTTRRSEILEELKTEIENHRKLDRNENKDQFDEILKILDSHLDQIKNLITTEHEITRKSIDGVNKKIETLSNTIITHPAFKNIAAFKKRIIFGLFDPVASFTGRQKELENLHTTLFASQKIAIISQAATITGLGGVGKTTLALKYALDYEQFYYNIVFIKSEKLENIVKSFKDLATRMGIAVKETEEHNQNSDESRKQDRDIKEIVQDIFNNLNDQQKSLIIFDNVENYVDIKDFIFKGSSLNRYIYTLITSRRKDLYADDNGEFEMITLEVFSEKEAVDYVRYILTNENQDDIKKLSRQLGYLPLALKHATGYIKSRNNEEFSILDYLKLIEMKKEIIIGPYLGNCDKILTMTWQISLDKIREDPVLGELAVKIFNIIAYLSPEDIEVWKLFRKFEKDSLKTKNAIILLRNYSLIDIDTNVRVNVHRVVQQATRHNLKNKYEEENTLKDAFNLLNETNFEEHAVCVWEYASEYSQLLNTFYRESKYGKNKNGPLHLLAMYRDRTNVEKFCKKIKNIDINCENASGHTPLDKAAENGNQEVVEYFLEKGNVKDVSNALKYAAANGHYVLVDFICGKYETFLNKDELIFQSKLRRAITQKNIEVYNELIQSYPQYLESKFEGAFGENILHFAAKHNDVKIMEIFLNNGIDVNVLDTRKMTPIYYAIENNSENALNFLLKSKADINNVDEDGETPLHCVINKGNKTLCKIILEENPKIDTCDKLGRTAIHLAAKNQNEDICEMVLEKKPEINVRDNSGKTPLHYAIEYFSSNKMCGMIVEEGADINMTDDAGKTPMHYAVEYNHETALLMMFNKEPRFEIQDIFGKTLLHYAVEYNYETICTSILSNSQNINIPDNYEKTPIYYAIQSNNETICSTLLNKGAKVDLTDKLGKSPLHYAVEYNNETICEYILSKAQNINITDTDGKTPIYYAIQSNNETICRILLKKGTKVDHRDNSGKTPLHYAVENNDETICEYILWKAQNINIADNDGKTPMHYAIEYNYKAIQEMLLEHNSETQEGKCGCKCC
ncbi:uncharacterized protein LOC143920063 [Arctopsyche grandis]|uniref:uncharacterized protein LOC143920063 n=1 Tax=Arctopsyche grandis TaxID=121162 RepID=UPI00406D661A